MKINNKGVTIVELLVSLALLSVVLMFLYNLLSNVTFEKNTDFIANSNQANRIDIINTIENDLILDNNIEIENSEKSERIIKLLDTIQFLWRDIRGRRENLNPLFAVGGIYERKNPYFEDRLKLTKNGLDTELIKSVKDSCEDTQSNTIIGYVPGFFSNEDEITSTLSPVNISEMFTKIKEEVKAYYA